MYPRFERDHHRLFITLVVTRRIDGKPRPKRIGRLGSISAQSPPSATDRIAFWEGFDARLGAIAANHPISPADAEKVREMLARRISPPQTPEELRLRSKAIVQRDVLAAFDLGPDAMARAAERLAELAREIQDHTKLKEPA